MISQMSIPPWVLAIVVLIVAAGVGAYTISSTHVFEGEGFTAPPNSRRYIVPPLANPIPDAYANQPYGIHDRSIHPSHVRVGGDPIFNFNPNRMEGFASGKSQGEGYQAQGESTVETKTLYPGLDQNITATQQPIAYSGIAETQTNTPLTQQLQKVQAIAKGTIPTDQNLQMINGGTDESANTPLSQAYQPHQERIYPDQHPRPQYTQLTAGVLTDAGTGAEEIQKASVRTPSIREHVREEEAREVESFNNPYAVQYQQI